MSELIDIWETIELLSDKRSDCNFFVDGQTAYEALSDMIKAVKELPRIDLVRCGECKHHDEDGWGYGNCQRPSVDYLYLRTANEDFCSYGERKDDGSMD